MTQRLDVLVLETKFCGFESHSRYMVEVVVYLKLDYSENESIWVDNDLEKEEITKIVNEKFDLWYFYDIM